MKRIINFCVLAITILSVNLLTGFITDYFLHYKNITNPMKFTALGMLVLVAVFYPIFEYMESKVEALARGLIKKGNNAMGKRLGFVIVFSILILILYCIYANLWFKINVPRILINRIF
jgi:hypothetical protein